MNKKPKKQVDVHTICIYNTAMRYEWDKNKNEANISKHGIDFADVPEMFEFPMNVEIDTRHDYGEDRWVGIGLLRMIVAVVVYVERVDEKTIRIISARKATRIESKQYYEQIKD